MFPLIASSLLSGFMNMSQQHQYLNQQSRENERVYQRNRQLAQEQNAFNLAQWNRENKYNLPNNQMRRLKDAGINPHLAFSNGVSGLTAANSPTMSAGAPLTPTDYTMNGQRKTMGDVINQSLELAHKKAIIDNINKDTELKKSQKEGTDLTNTTILSMSSAKLKETLANAGFKEEETKNVIAERDNIVKNGNLIDENIRKSVAERLNLSFEQWLKVQELELKKEETLARIREIASKCNLNDAQTEQLKKSLPLILEKLGNEVYNTGAQGELLAGEIIMQASEQIILGNEVTLSNLTTTVEASKLKDRADLRERFSGAYYLGQAISDLLGGTTGAALTAVAKAVVK